MPHSDDRASRRLWPIGAFAAACFGGTLWAFYPGVMTYDANFVYIDALKGFRGDWQSPVMTSLWAWIDPIAPGTASMFMLIAALYWLGFGLLALAVARRSGALAIVLILLAMSPPLLMFVAIIWRDVLFAGLWLVAAALCFLVADRETYSARSRASGNPEPPSQTSLGPRLLKDERADKALGVTMQAIALGLIAFGVLLRPNALIAAPVLAAYAVWPAQFRWKRAAILFVPAALGLFGLMNVVYYGVLNATRQHLVQTIMVFDLGGISHFAKENQYPLTLSDVENRQLLNECYTPNNDWDIYWRVPPCNFVMDKLEHEQKLFGTPVVTKAWLSAIARHPVAYLMHRSTFFWNFTTCDQLTLWVFNIDDLSKPVLGGRASSAAMEAPDSALKPTPILRVGSWLLLCVGVCAFAWPRRETPAGAFAIAVSGSGALYVLTFFGVGVALDFRYAYWGVISGVAGVAVLATALRRRSP